MHSMPPQETPHARDECMRQCRNAPAQTHLVDGHLSRILHDEAERGEARAAEARAFDGDEDVAVCAHAKGRECPRSLPAQGHDAWQALVLVGTGPVPPWPVG